MAKEITVVFYGRHFPRSDWKYEIDPQQLAAFSDEIRNELSTYDVGIQFVEDENITMKVNGYGDLLNAVRIRSPQDGISSKCLGHIIGPSPHANLFEDLKRGINRVAFAPETIEPEENNRTVCHNCGCGC